MLYIANYGSGGGGSGTVTSIATGTGLTGGTITTTGTIALASSLQPMATLAGNSLKYLRVNAGETAVEWATVTGGGDVYKVGTPANNQIGVWTGDGTIEGDSNFTYDGSTNTLMFGVSSTIETPLQTVTDADGADIGLSAGGGNNTGAGGDILIQAGNGGLLGNGGHVNITSGFCEPGALPGNITFIPANDDGTTTGHVQIFDSISGRLLILDTSQLATSDKTVTFQNQTGTLALTSQSVDYEVTDNTKGLILKSADGTRWRIGITNSGELTATSL